MNPIIEELQFNDKFLCENFKNSKYYRDYLKKVMFNLINQTKSYANSKDKQNTTIEVLQAPNSLSNDVSRD